MPGIVLKPAFFGPRQHFGEFDANGTADPDGEDFTYAWDFGDGSAPVTSSLKVHHAYAAGHFQLSFTATDEAGVSATSTIGIEVMNTYVPPPVNTADTTAPTFTLGNFALNKKGTALTTKATCPPTEKSCAFVFEVAAAGKAGSVGKAKYSKRVSVTVLGGESRSVVLKLNKAALKLLKKTGKLKTAVVVRVTDAAGNAATRTVRYSAKQGKTGSAK